MTPVVRDGQDQLDRQAERVPPEPERRLEVGDDQRDVVDLAEAADVLGRPVALGWAASAAPLRR